MATQGASAPNNGTMECCSNACPSTDIEARNGSVTLESGITLPLGSAARQVNAHLAEFPLHAAKHRIDNLALEATAPGMAVTVGASRRHAPLAAHELADQMQGDGLNDALLRHVTGTSLNGRRFLACSSGEPTDAFSEPARVYRCWDPFAQCAVPLRGGARYPSSHTGATTTQTRGSVHERDSRRCSHPPSKELDELRTHRHDLARVHLRQPQTVPGGHVVQKLRGHARADRHDRQDHIFRRFLKPFLRVLGHKRRRKWCLLYLRGQLLRLNKASNPSPNTFRPDSTPCRSEGPTRRACVPAIRTRYRTRLGGRFEVVAHGGSQRRACEPVGVHRFVGGTERNPGSCRRTCWRRGFAYGRRTTRAHAERWGVERGVPARSVRRGGHGALGGDARAALLT